MKFFFDGDNITVSQIEEYGKPSNPLSFEMLNSPCKNRPDTNQPCLVHTARINGRRIPKNNIYCGKCPYIFGNPKRHYMSDIEIVERIKFEGVKLTSPYNRLPSVDRIIKWNGRCLGCIKPINNKYKYCKECHKIVRIRMKKFQKKFGTSKPSNKYLHSGIKKWREEND